jgi:glutamine amidotransferase
VNSIVIIDYGMGNLRSVQKALERVGAKAEIARDPDVVRRAEKVLLPGVGAFADAIAELKRLGMDQAACEHVRAGKPLLGVCLGLQLLLRTSYEDGEHEGLGLVAGQVERFAEDMTGADGKRLKVPHMGWNAVRIVQRNPLLEGIEEGTYFYFVHSYYAKPASRTDVALEAEHGLPFCAMIARGNLFATQFHPEKSQKEGLRIYENFVKM